MAVLERTYTVPLRREWLKAPRYKRAKRAISALRSFLTRHMKSEDIRVGTSINLEIWKHGMKNPPGRVKINVQKDDEGIVRAELFGVAIVKPEEKKEDKKGIAQKVAEAVTGKKETPKAAPKPQAAPKPAAPKTETPKPETKPTPTPKPAAPAAKPAPAPAAKPTPTLNLKQPK